MREHAQASFSDDLSVRVQAESVIATFYVIGQCDQHDGWQRKIAGPGEVAAQMLDIRRDKTQDVISIHGRRQVYSGKEGV